MQSSCSVDDLLDFLAYAGERGLVPVATAQALAVATRTVFSVVGDADRAESLDDVDGVIKRFDKKRAHDFSPVTLKEYARRVRRAVEMYQQWTNDPDNFAVKTRATNASRRKKRTTERQAAPGSSITSQRSSAANAAPLDVPDIAGSADGYQTAFPVRPGHVVVMENIPADLSAAEAERLAQFIRLLASATSQPADPLPAPDP